MHSIDLETALSPAEHFVEYFLNKNYFFKSMHRVFSIKRILRQKIDLNISLLLVNNK